MPKVTKNMSAFGALRLAPDQPVKIAREMPPVMYCSQDRLYLDHRKLCATRLHRHQPFRQLVQIK